MTLKEENTILKRNLAYKTASETQAVKDSMRCQMELNNAKGEIDQLKEELEQLKNRIKDRLFDEGYEKGE